MGTKLLQNTSAIVLWLLAIVSVAAQPRQWSQTQLGDSVTIKFPDAPTRQEMAEGVVYFTRNEEIAFITAVKQKAYEADSPVDELATFYNSTLKGMLEAGGGGKIVKQQAVELNGFPAIRAQLLMNKNAKITGPYFNQIVLVDGTCYAQSVLILGEATPALLADKDSFFTSFDIAKHRVIPGDPQRNTAAYRVGQLAGTVLIYGGLGALFFFLLRRKGKAAKRV